MWVEGEGRGTACAATGMRAGRCLGGRGEGTVGCDWAVPAPHSCDVAASSSVARYVLPAEVLDTYQSFVAACECIKTIQDLDKVLFGEEEACVTLSVVKASVADVLRRTAKAYLAAEKRGFGRGADHQAPASWQVTTMATLYNMVGLRSKCVGALAHCHTWLRVVLRTKSRSSTSVCSQG